MGKVLACVLAVGGLWSASLLPAQEPSRLTLIPATQMAALVESQNKITVLVGQAYGELAIAPSVGERNLGPLLVDIETATARSRSLSESFATVAVADGLSLPLAALCAKVAGARPGRLEEVGRLPRRCYSGSRPATARDMQPTFVGE